MNSIQSSDYGNILILVNASFIEKVINLPEVTPASVTQCKAIGVSWFDVVHTEWEGGATCNLYKVYLPILTPQHVEINPDYFSQ